MFYRVEGSSESCSRPHLHSKNVQGNKHLHRSVREARTIKRLPESLLLQLKGRKKVQKSSHWRVCLKGKSNCPKKLQPLDPQLSPLDNYLRLIWPDPLRSAQRIGYSAAGQPQIDPSNETSVELQAEN